MNVQEIIDESTPLDPPKPQLDDSVIILGEKSEKSVRSKKQISLVDALAIVFGSIIGSGIFLGVQEPYKISGSEDIVFVMVFWLLYGLITMCNGLVYAELGTRIPTSGGDAAYLKAILSESLSFVFIFVFVFVIKPLTAAGLGLTAATYILNIFVKDPKSYYYTVRLIGIGLLLTCLIITCFSKFLATKTGVVTTVLKTGAILFIIGSGLYYQFTGTTNIWKQPFQMSNFTLDSLRKAMSSTYWAYDGANILGLVAGDMINPRRDLPLAILIGIGVIVVLYVLTVMSYPLILGYNAALTSSAVAYDCALKVLKKGAPVISLLIATSAFGSAVSNMFSVSSASSAAGITGEFPTMFSLVSQKGRTPVFSAVFMFVLSCIGIFLDFNTILGYVSFMSLVFYSFTYLSLWVIKIRTRKQIITGIFTIHYILIVPIQLLAFVVIILFVINELQTALNLLLVIIALYGLKQVQVSLGNKTVLFLKKTHKSIIEWCEKHLNLELANIGDIS